MIGHTHRIRGNSRIPFEREEGGIRGEMSSERTKRKGKEEKGKERKGKGKAGRTVARSRGAHAAVRLGSSTSSGMQGITYRNTTTTTTISITTSPPTAHRASIGSIVHASGTTCESTLLDRPTDPLLLRLEPMTHLA